MRNIALPSRLFLVLAWSSVLLLSSCDTTDPDEGWVVEGVDLDQLFAPPAPSEVEAVRAEWQQRDVSAQGYQVEVDSLVTLVGTSVRLRLRVLSHTVGGARHYAAVIVPEGAAAGSLPVLFYNHGGDEGVNVDDTLPLLPSALQGHEDAFVFVIPSFRSEPLIFDGVPYLSEGAPSPWDRDVDDALALLNVTLETTPEADPARIGVLGFSRGAGVGLLMAVRDPRIDLVVEFFGPTDFFGPFVQDVVVEALQGQLRELPGLDYLNTAYIQPLQRGDLRIEDVRPELVRRSAVLFADRLPQVQLHHGTADTIVPVSQAESLIAAMEALGRTAPAFEAYLYPGGAHNPLTLPESLSRTALFLSRLL